MDKYNPITMNGANYREMKGFEKSACTDVKMTNGFGRLSIVGATVTKGVKGRIKIYMSYSTFHSSAYEKCTEELKNSVTSEKYEHLKECERRKDYKGWWFWLVSASETEYNHDKDQTIVEKHIEDTEISNVVEKMFSQEQQKYRILGEFDIEGQSNVPTKVEMYISTLNIQTSAGNSVSVIDTESQPVLVDPDTGRKAEAKIISEEKLTVVPL